MSKIADYLNENISGEVVSSSLSRKKFSNDSSVISIQPSLVVHPRTTDDIRKITRFAWRLAEKGQNLPLTARGSGSDITGAAIGDGLMLSMPSHMSDIMEFEPKSRLIRVQAGVSIYALQQAASLSGLCLPIDNGLTRINTIGGAISNNAVSDRFLQYGTIADWLNKLEVVLPNGEIIQTGRISRRELSEKKGMQSLEGEIYRTLDSLIEDNREVVDGLIDYPALDGFGYAIDRVKGHDGSFDLTPLFVGAQGTLGVITQAIVELAPKSDLTGVLCVAVPRGDAMSRIVPEISGLEPSSIYAIDGSTLSMIYDISGTKPWSGVVDGLPDMLLVVGFSGKNSQRKLRKAGKILSNLGIESAVITSDPSEIDGVMTIVDSLAVVTNCNYDKSVAIPMLSQVSVPVDVLLESMLDIRSILDELRISASISSNVGAGLIAIHPVVNLSNLSDRQAVFRAIDRVSELVTERSGSITGTNRGGRLLSPWTGAHCDKAAVDLFGQIKKLFDPYTIMNPGIQDKSIERSDLAETIVKSYSPDLSLTYNLRG